MQFYLEQTWDLPTPTPRPAGQLPEEYTLDFETGFDMKTSAYEAVQTYNTLEEQTLFVAINYLMLIIVVVFGAISIVRHVQYMGRDQ